MFIDSLNILNLSEMHDLVRFVQGRGMLKVVDRGSSSLRAALKAETLTIYSHYVQHDFEILLRSTIN